MVESCKSMAVADQDALKDQDNQKFIFVSESCIPLYSLSSIYEFIMKDDCTYMTYARRWWPIHSPREVHELSPEFRYGNMEWVVLNRAHAELIAKDKSIIKIISRHDHDQESYFATLFAIHNCLDAVCNHSYTYTDWDHPTNGGRSPWVFNEVSEFNDELIEEAYLIGSLFARKFTINYPEGILLQMIRDHKLKQ